MKPRVFKPAIAVFIALIATCSIGFAQDNAAKPTAADTVRPVVTTDITNPVTITVKPNISVKLHRLTANIKTLSMNANMQVMAAVNNITANVNAGLAGINPQVSLDFNNGDADDITDRQDVNELHKNYTKSYSVDANDGLVIDNRYGKVVVNTWARNEIKVDVQIKVGADDAGSAQKILDNVNISDSKDGNTINFKTNINEIKSSWTSMFSGNSGSRHMEINYTVYMPAKNDLTIDNRYGPIEMPDMDGKVNINSAYGSLKAGSIPAQSTVRVKYGSAVMGNVGVCAIDLSYGSLSLGAAGKLAANVSYSGIKIEKVIESAAINVKYGDGVNIGDLDKSMRDLAINVSYSNVRIGLSGDENANFDVTTHYGDFGYNDHNITITAKTPEDDGRPHFTKSYKGHIGSGNANGRHIAVNTSYGNINFE